MDDDMRNKLKAVSQQYEEARERNESYKHRDTRDFNERRTDTLEERRLEFEQARLQYINDKDRYTP